MKLFSKKHERATRQVENLPRHVAIILDGNGRWAKRRALPRTAGHKAGAENFRNIATYCKELGIEYLTVYAFSTENWKRPPEEVSAIMQLLENYLHESIETMSRENIRLRFLGDTSVLTPELRALIEKTNAISEGIEGFQANICLNYGGRDEIVRAAGAYAEDVRNGAENDLTEEAFSRYLYSDGIPDPELMIRTSGEQRLSNFLLWQCAYAEFYFTDVLWPDFDRTEFDRALEVFSKRDRRFGGVK